MLHGKTKLEQLHPVWRDLVMPYLEYLDSQGAGGTIYDVWRSSSDQDRRFKLGETNARGGQSAHNVTRRGKPAALAFDYVVSQGELSPMQFAVQQFWADNGFTVITKGVGPRGAPDPAHVEFPNWRAVASS